MDRDLVLCGSLPPMAMPVSNTFIQFRTTHGDGQDQVLRRVASEPAIPSIELDSPASLHEEHMPTVREAAASETEASASNGRHRKRLSQRERSRLRRQRERARAQVTVTTKEEDAYEWVHVDVEEAIAGNSPPTSEDNAQGPTGASLPHRALPSTSLATTPHNIPAQDQFKACLVTVVCIGAVGLSGLGMARPTQQKHSKQDKHSEGMATSVSVPPAKFPKGAGNVCAVGSTGNGKSCWLNFMINPCEEHCFHPERQTFVTGETNTSCTNQCRVEGRKRFKFIDTAGANESHEADLRHMIDTAKMLRSVAKLSVVALVLKYKQRMDQQWKDTIYYYCKLIGPHAFKSNLIIILTDYDLAKLGKNQKMWNDQVHQSIISEIQDAVKDLLDLADVPKVFAIDCLPDEAHREKHEQTRLEILSYVAAQQPVDVSGIMVEKTARLKEIDMQKIKIFEGEVNQLKVRFEVADTVPDVIKEKLNRSSQEKAQLKVEMNELKQEIDELDTDDLVLAAHHSDHRPFRKTQDNVERITMEARCDIASRTVYSSDDFLDIRFLEIGRTRATVEIRKAARWGQHLLKHGTRQGISYEIKLWAYRKNFYGNDIRSKESTLDSKKRELAELSSLEHSVMLSHPEAVHAASKLSVDIQEREQKIRELRRTNMTIEEAEQRFPDLLQASKL